MIGDGRRFGGVDWCVRELRRALGVEGAPGADGEMIGGASEEVKGERAVGGDGRVSMGRWGPHHGC